MPFRDTIRADLDSTLFLDSPGRLLRPILRNTIQSKVMEQKSKDLRDFLDILSRRKKHLLPLLLIIITGAAVAPLLPSLYKSTTTILIEEQQIPTDLVRTTVTGFAEERIQIITQRIMSRSRLLEIVNRFNLYQNLKKKRTSTKPKGHQTH